MNYLKRPRSLHASVFAYYVLSGGRFTAPFLEHVAGFSDTRSGVALAIQVGTETVLGPLAGSIADIMERRYPHYGRAYVITAGVVTGTIAFVMQGLVSLACGDDYLLSCSTNTATALHMILRLVYSIGNAFIYPVLNGMTLAYLEEEGCSPSQYGRERLYGAISWAIASVIVGYAIDIWGFRSMCFTFAPLGCALFLSTIIVFVRGLEERTGTIGRSSATRAMPQLEVLGDSHEETERSYPLLRLLVVVCGSIYGFGFITAMITLRAGMAIVESLIFLFFEEALRGTYTAMGLTVVVTVIFEVPLFYLAPKLLDLLGPGRLQQLASVAYMTRVIGYTVIPQGAMAWVLLFEPLHGVTIACASTSSVEYMAQLSPKGYEASGQGLLSGLGGIGGIIGLSLGGWIEDTFGAKFMYRAYATVVAIGLAIFLFTEAWRGGYHRLGLSTSSDNVWDVCYDDVDGDCNDKNSEHIELPTVRGRNSMLEGKEQCRSSNSNGI